tara:strand:- start:2903 stop:3193 length:291 start_codon:yes stop_codon:yes gene_type:complete
VFISSILAVNKPKLGLQNIINHLEYKNKMINKKLKIGQKVILNCKNFVSQSNLDDDGWFAVYGVITGFTKKRIKAVNELRNTEGFYKPENVRGINK